MLFDEDEIPEDDPEDVRAEEEPLRLLDPAHQTQIIGHDKIETDLAQSFQSGKIPHALIFSGMKGIGKATFAYRLARSILGAEETSGALFDARPFDTSSDDPVFLKVASGGHPDFKYLGLEFDDKKGKLEDSLKIDKIRDVAPFLHKTASAGGWRVVIIDDADSMNRNAQNAILKILEEPPKNALLIMVTHRIGALIPTILSRSRVIEFSPLAEPQMDTLLSKYAPQSTASASLTLAKLWGDGSIGKALEFLEGDNEEILADALDVLNKTTQLSTSEIDTLTKKYARLSDMSKAGQLVTLIQWLIYNAIKQEEGALSHSSDTAKITGFYAAKPLEQWLEIWESLGIHKRKCIASHLDRTVLIRGALEKIKGL